MQDETERVAGTQEATGPGGRLARWAWRWLPAVCWATVLVVASLVDPPGAGSVGTGPLGLVGLDKYQHVAGYALLGALVSRAHSPHAWRGAAVAVALTVGVGAGVEVAQAFVPVRASDPVDAGANALGAVFGVLCWLVVARIQADT